jgi:hypothetical protein
MCPVSLCALLGLVARHQRQQDRQERRALLECRRLPLNDLTCSHDLGHQCSTLSKLRLDADRAFATLYRRRPLHRRYTDKLSQGARRKARAVQPTRQTRLPRPANAKARRKGSKDGRSKTAAAVRGARAFLILVRRRLLLLERSFVLFHAAEDSLLQLYSRIPLYRPRTGLLAGRRSGAEFRIFAIFQLIQNCRSDRILRFSAGS